MNFLETVYMDKFISNLNKDICPLVPTIINESDTCDSLFLGTMRNGFKAVLIRYFELLRFLSVEIKDPNIKDILNTQEFSEIGIIKF